MAARCSSAFADVAAADHQHQHEVHAIAVHAFGRRLAGLLGAGLDAELMHLHMPAAGLRQKVVAQVAEPAQHGGQRVAFQYL